MEIVNSLHRIEPERWRAATDRLTTNPPASEADVRALFAEYGAPGLEDLLVEVDYYEVNELPFDGLLNQICLLLTNAKEYYLHTSLHHGLCERFREVPALSPLAGLAVHDSYDVALPDALQAREDGLMGVWSAGRLDPGLEAAKRMADKEAVLAHAATLPEPLLKRVLGSNKTEAGRLREWAADDGYLWRYWQTIVAALEETVKDGVYLGFSMIKAGG